MATAAMPQPGKDRSLTQNSRKFAGVFVLIALLVVYPMLAVWIYELLPTIPWWAQVIYFAIAGLCWAFPAGVVIKWMVYPDPD